MSKIKIIILLIAMFFSGILVAPTVVNAAQKVFDKTANIETESDLRWSAGTLIRFDDPKFRVKCWAIDGDRKGGISCLPWDEVKER